jgi:hypothetical protein
MRFERIAGCAAVLCTPLVLLLAGCSGGKGYSQSSNPDVAALEALGAEFKFDEANNPISVGLKGQRITDAELRRLKPLTSLTRVIFSGAAITDAGVENLTALSKLENLGFHGTGLTDAGLQHLRQLPLTILLLIDADIGDAGLEHLKAISTLKNLNIRGTKATPEGVAALKQALPNCNITY